MIRGILFDLDGTLLDTLQDLRSAVNHVMEEHGFPEHTTAETMSFVGNGVGVLIDKACPEGTDPGTVEQCLKEFKEWYFAHSMELTKPYPGVPEMLHTCREMGLVTGVVSNKFETAVQSLLEAQLPGLIDHCTGDIPGYPRKPDPANVLRCLQKMGIDEISEVIYVGDSETDVLTAKNAGIQMITVTWGFRDRALLEEFGAPCPVADTDELLEQIRRIRDTSC